MDDELDELLRKWEFVSSGSAEDVSQLTTTFGESTIENFNHDRLTHYELENGRLELKLNSYRRQCMHLRSELNLRRAEVDKLQSALFHAKARIDELEGVGDGGEESTGDSMGNCRRNGKHLDESLSIARHHLTTMMEREQIYKEQIDSLRTGCRVEEDETVAELRNRLDRVTTELELSRREIAVLKAQPKRGTVDLDQQQVEVGDGVGREDFAPPFETVNLSKSESCDEFYVGSLPSSDGEGCPTMRARAMTSSEAVEAMRRNFLERNRRTK